MRLLSPTDLVRWAVHPRHRFVTFTVLAFSFVAFFGFAASFHDGTRQYWTTLRAGNGSDAPIIPDEPTQDTKIPDPAPPPSKDVPPSHDYLRELEMNLPQHNLSLPFPEGKTGRFLLFKNQVQMLGWNNILNSVLMETWLAYKSGRAYVFQDYLWSPDHYPWPELANTMPRTPLPALLSGPTSGGPWPPGDPAPRSVSEAWFNVVCPQEERRIINTREVKPPINSAQGTVIFARWETLLRDAPERCIVIQGADEDMFSQTFDLWLWGSDRILSLWEGFRDSPVSQLLGPSPIIQAAVTKNEHLFIPQGSRAPATASRDPYNRVLAMHLRRGDYAGQCMHLAKYKSTFYSWDQLHSLPDRYVPTAESSPEEDAKVIDRCFPTSELIVAKARQAREDYARDAGSNVPPLDVLFLLTNGKKDWLDELIILLRKDGWSHIVTTKNLSLDQQEKEVGMAIDMELAGRSAVFIGNGWSSFSSNIVHRRLVAKKKDYTNRFF